MESFSLVIEKNIEILKKFIPYDPSIFRSGKKASF